MKRRLSRIAKWTFIVLIMAHLGLITYTVKKRLEEVDQIRVIPYSLRTFEIQSGKSLKSVLQDLTKHELAPPPIWMRLAMLLKDRNIVVKHGKYQLRERMSPWEILELLDKGKVAMTSITVREGLNKWETADALGKSQWGNKEEFTELINTNELIRDLDPEAEDLEGYLFPETYSFEEETTARMVVETMVRQFRKEAEPMIPRARALGLTLREWVTIASMVELESAVPQERKRIAGVFMNRRARKMQYQCDPTIVYALMKDNQYRGKIYRSDLTYQSPYNTYVAPGLPPGPIASPGRESLMAVLDHETHKYLYFVSKNDGTHHFSTTLKEHNRQVRKYQR